ncbi:MAG: ketopantoate reductase C-terminal domain-containing protein [Pseudomonadota bacterium]
MILLIGPGAVGTILATHLMAAKKEPLRLYVREKYLATMQALPQLQMDYMTKRAPLVAEKPELTTSLDLTGVDYIFLCVKFPDLDALLSQLPPIPPNCTLVSTLNGIAPLRLIKERLPHAKLVPMSVMFNGQLPAALHAKITTKAQVLIGSDDTRLLNCFEGSGLQVLRAQGESAVWGKLLINLANAVCAITHTTFRDLLSQPDMRAIYVAVLDEAVALLELSNIPYQLLVPLPYPAYRKFILHGGPLPWWVAQIKNGLKDGAYPSMVSDIEQQRRTEVDQLNGEIILLAKQRGMQAPISTRIVEMVKAIEGQAQPVYLSPKELRLRLGI